MDNIRKIFSRISQTLKNSNPVVIAHDNPNRVVLTVCRRVEFPEPNIRQALVELNGLKMQKLANGVAASTLYRALKGENAHQGARIILADALGLRVEELFSPSPLAGEGRGEGEPTTP